MSHLSRIRSAIKSALAAGSTVAFAYAPGYAVAQGDEEVLEQGRVTVTGSRIRRATTETSSPV